MYVLKEEQVRFIFDDIRRNGIETEELQLNLLDHICCVIENEMSSDAYFEEFYKGILPRFFKHRLSEIQEETDLLLTFKNYYAMKKVMITSGTITAFSFITGAFFKVMHWPGASVLMLLSITLLCFVFLPILFVLKSKEAKAKQDKVVIGIATFFGILISLAVLFKIMHWPYANIMWTTSLGILFFLFLPIYFFSGIRNPQTKTNTIVSSILILTSAGLLFMLTNLKSSRWTEEAVFNSDDQLRASYLFVKEQNALKVNDSLPTAKKEFIQKIEAISSNIELLKAEIIEQTSFESESEAIRNVGYNYNMTEVKLFDENGKGSKALLKIKADIAALNAHAKSSFEKDFTEILNTQDVDKYRDPAEGKISWEENNFKNIPLGNVLRNFNQILLNLQLIEQAIN